MAAEEISVLELAGWRVVEWPPLYSSGEDEPEIFASGGASGGV